MVDSQKFNDFIEKIKSSFFIEKIKSSSSSSTNGQRIADFRKSKNAKAAKMQKKKKKERKRERKKKKKKKKKKWRCKLMVCQHLTAVEKFQQWL